MKGVPEHAYATLRKHTRFTVTADGVAIAPEDVLAVPQPAWHTARCAAALLIAVVLYTGVVDGSAAARLTLLAAVALIHLAPWIPWQFK